MGYRHAIHRMLCLVWLAAVSQARSETLEAPDTLYREGMGHFSAGNYPAAAGRFQELIDRFGAEAEFAAVMEQVYYALGCSCYNAGDLAAAIKAFEEYVRRYPSAQFLDEALFRMGAAHQGGQEYADAIQAYRRLIEARPDSAYAEDAGYQVGMCYFFQEEYENAAKTFEEFCGTYPRSDSFAQAAVFRARSLFETGKWQAALDVLTSLSGVSRTLDHIAYANFLAMEIGDVAFDETDYTLALKAYRRVQTREYLIRVQQGVVRSLEAALEELGRRTAGMPGEALHSFREERRLKSSLDSARELLEKIRSAPSYDAGLYHRIGRCFFNSDRFWEARVAFARVVEIAEDRTVREAAMFDLALVLSRQRRFEDLVQIATRYLDEYGNDQALIENGRVPTMALMRAECYINMERFEEAEQEMRALLENYPLHPQRARIDFYLALALAMQEKFEEGIGRFRDWIETYPDDILQPEVAYWLPIALYYGGQQQEALPMLQDYAARYPLSVYAPEAEYRAAMCMYALEQFTECAIALGGWLKKYPEHHFKDEARVARGGALAAIGKLEDARKDYMAVGPQAGPFYYMARTECAKVFKAMNTPEAYRDMAAAFAEYIHNEPDSGNVIDAAYQAGWALRQVGQNEEAHRLYWQIIGRHGNGPEWEGFTPLFEDLGKLYAGEAARTWEDDLRKLYQQALADRRLTLAARLRVALERVPGDVQANRVLADELARSFSMDKLGAEELAFLATAYADAGEGERGLPYLQRILDVYPGSRFAALAHARMAQAALAAGDAEKALAAAETSIDAAYDVGVLIDASYIRAQCLEKLGRHEPAVEAYTLMLANRATPKGLKPRCLLGIGRAYQAMGEPRKAIPYLQRIYVLYGAYTNEVAQAYLLSGQAFEGLRDVQAAVQTYEEMLGMQALAQMEEGRQAQARLAKLRL